MGRIVGELGGNVHRIKPALCVWPVGQYGKQVSTSVSGCKKRPPRTGFSGGLDYPLSPQLSNVITYWYQPCGPGTILIHIKNATLTYKYLYIFFFGKRCVQRVDSLENKVN